MTFFWLSLPKTAGEFVLERDAGNHRVAKDLDGI